MVGSVGALFLYHFIQVLGRYIKWVEYERYFACNFEVNPSSIVKL